jgi:hypothetical protein
MKFEYVHDNGVWYYPVGDRYNIFNAKYASKDYPLVLHSLKSYNVSFVTKYGIRMFSLSYRKKFLILDAATGVEVTADDNNEQEPVQSLTCVDSELRRSMVDSVQIAETGVSCESIVTSGNVDMPLETDRRVKNFFSLKKYMSTRVARKYKLSTANQRILQSAMKTMYSLHISHAKHVRWLKNHDMLSHNRDLAAQTVEFNYSCMNGVFFDTSDVNMRKLLEKWVRIRYDTGMLNLLSVLWQVIRGVPEPTRSVINLWPMVGASVAALLLCSRLYAYMRENEEVIVESTCLNAFGKIDPEKVCTFLKPAFEFGYFVFFKRGDDCRLFTADMVKNHPDLFDIVKKKIMKYYISHSVKSVSTYFSPYSVPCNAQTMESVL